MNEVNYTVPDHIQFVKDMRDAGLKVELYHGRYWWHGPSVDIDDLQDALSNTKVKCQWDNMGKGYVVYPKTNDPTLNGLYESNDDDDNEDN